MTQTPPSIITGDSITIFLQGKSYTATSTHANFNEIIDAYKHGSYHLLPELFDIKKAVVVFAQTDEDFVINQHTNTITYKGVQIDNTMVDRILTMMSEGFDITPMTNLLRNLYANPSKKAVDELYAFLEYGKMPITPDGCFLAYKRVNGNYTSCYDNKTDNNIGNVVSMPRNAVDDRSDNTCSHGLHICSFEYLAHYYGARVIVVKVNPADVVSIPTDYNNTKARVCQYEVIGELTREEANLPTHDFGTSVYEEDWDDEDWDDDPDVNDGEDWEDEDEPTQYNWDGDFDDPEVDCEIVVTPETASLQDVAADLSSNHDTISKYYNIGYTSGYDDGKKKPLPAISGLQKRGILQDAPIWALTVMDDGYVAGVKDGKGHRSRKCPTIYSIQ
jgi:hypothetical protein